MPLNTALRLDTPFLFHESITERRTSALRLVAHLLKLEGVLPIHHRELLSIAMWKWTEACGVAPYAKYRLRMRSAGAIDMATPAPVNHEHVFPRRWLVDQLLAGRGRWDEESLRTFLATYGVACTVTVEEHARLRAASGVGWQRYASAGVGIFDMQTQEPVSPELLQPDDAVLSSVPEIEDTDGDPVDEEAEVALTGFIASDVESVLAEQAHDVTPLLRQLIEALSEEPVAVVVGRSRDAAQPIYLRVHDTVVEEPTPAVAFVHFTGRVSVRLLDTDLAESFLAMDEVSVRVHDRYGISCRLRDQTSVKIAHELIQLALEKVRESDLTDGR